MHRVLYVDDEMGLLEIGKIFLEQSGDFLVDTVLSGQEAMALMSETSFDAVVSDYQMPEINGIELLKMVRMRYAPLPFILFTGRGREEVVSEALNNGADFYLQKGGDPISQFAELRHHLRLAITRHENERKLRSSEERFRRLIENVPVAVGIGRKGRTIYANHRYAMMFGYEDMEEFLGRPFIELVAVQDRERVMKNIGSEAIISREMEEELMGVRRDGSLFPFHVTVTYITLEDGEANIGVFTDITDQRQREEWLQSTMMHLQMAMDMAHIAFWTYDPGTMSMELNDQFYTLHGTTAEREGGYRLEAARYYHEFVHPDDLSYLLELERREREAGHPQPHLQYRFRMIRRDGEESELLVRLVFVRDAEGRLVQVQGVSQDITDMDQVLDGR
jgi:PAS domain S-box-containing protein